MCFIFTADITKAQRPVSAGTLSSNEDLDEGDGNVASFETSEFPPQHCELCLVFSLIYYRIPFGY